MTRAVILTVAGQPEREEDYQDSGEPQWLDKSWLARLGHVLKQVGYTVSSEHRLGEYNDCQVPCYLLLFLYPCFYQCSRVRAGAGARDPPWFCKEWQGKQQFTAMPIFSSEPGGPHW